MSTAARFLTNCAQCGGPVYENLVHHCGTAKRVASPQNHVEGERERAESYIEQLRNAPEPVHICRWSDLLSHSTRDTLRLAARLADALEEKAKFEAEAIWERQERLAALEENERLTRAIGKASYRLDPNQGERRDSVSARAWLRTGFPKEHPNYLTPEQAEQVEAGAAPHEETQDG